MDDLVEMSAQGELFEEKSYSSDMSMTEFIQWVNQNFGTLGVNDALKQAAFLICCDVISQDIAKSTLHLRERLDNGTSRIVMPMKHPVAGLLATEPNRRHTWYEFTEMMVLWHCITKNALAGIFRDNVDTPLELIPFLTNHVTERVWGRDVFYYITASTMQEQALLGESSLILPERDVIHVRGRMLDGMDGYSTMIAGENTLEAGKALDDFRGKLFDEEGMMRGVFRKKGAGAIDEKAFQRLRSQLSVLMSRFRSGTEPVVLEDDMEFQAISAKPSDLELEKQFHSQIISTARLLRVPPHKIFELDGTKYDNMETQEKMYVGDTLIPIAKQFEQRYGKCLLTGKDRLRFFFEYDREEMTLRDPQREIERLIKSLERGAITFDEFRAKTGHNLFPNGQGDCRMIPANMQVVDLAGKVVIAGSSKSDQNSQDPNAPDPNAQDTNAAGKDLDGARPVRLAVNNE